jgi:hypothetical protein
VQPGDQEVEDIVVRRREIDVAAPDPVPAAGTRVLDHAGGLRIVGDHVVEGIGQSLGVPDVVAAEDVLLFAGERARRALERVVNRLCDVEELVLAVDHAPLGLEAGVAHQRNERVEDLCHAAPEGRRREVEDPLPCERLRERLQLLHQPTADDGRVVRERLVADVYLLKFHGGGGYRRVRRIS